MRRQFVALAAAAVASAFAHDDAAALTTDDRGDTVLTPAPPAASHTSEPGSAEYVGSLGAWRASRFASHSAHRSLKSDDGPAILVGAHYFAGWYRCDGYGCEHAWKGERCAWGNASDCVSVGDAPMFGGESPRGVPTQNFFEQYPKRTPLLGNLTIDESTIRAELKAADRALDFFDILYYDGSAVCGPNPDPNLSWCLDSALAFMLNSSDIWDGIERLHFFISYSNDIDANVPSAFVGPKGAAKWSSLVATWVGAMRHPRYLKINGSPVFKILIPKIFVDECGGNVTLATALLAQLKVAAVAAGVGEPMIGGGWQNPSVPADSANPSGSPRPHPAGYMRYNGTKVACPHNCTLMTVATDGLEACQLLCNSTRGCEAITIDHSLTTCAVMSAAGPGAGDPTHDTYVRVAGEVSYDWTGTYNAAPPPDLSGRYTNSWMPNATSDGAKVFPYRECGDYQGVARGNHSHDRVPYLANVIAGFNPRPWQEQAPSFAFPSASEWETVLRQVKVQCEEPANRFGFPDASKPSGFQPAFNIYAWNECLLRSIANAVICVRCVQRAYN
jgi:hypothetical protein